MFLEATFVAFFFFNGPRLDYGRIDRLSSKFILFVKSLITYQQDGTPFWGHSVYTSTHKAHSLTHISSKKKLPLKIRK